MKPLDIILDNQLAGEMTRCIVFPWNAKRYKRGVSLKGLTSLYRNWYGNHDPMNNESFGKMNSEARGIKLGRVTRFNRRQVAKMMGCKITNLRKVRNEKR